jgi:hypothetical protein
MKTVKGRHSALAPLALFSLHGLCDVHHSSQYLRRIAWLADRSGMGRRCSQVVVCFQWRSPVMTGGSQVAGDLRADREGVFGDNCSLDCWSTLTECRII